MTSYLPTPTPGHVFLCKKRKSRLTAITVPTLLQCHLQLAICKSHPQLELRGSVPSASCDVQLGRSLQRRDDQSCSASSTSAVSSESELMEKPMSSASSGAILCCGLQGCERTGECVRVDARGSLVQMLRRVRACAHARAHSNARLHAHVYLMHVCAECLEWCSRLE